MTTPAHPAGARVLIRCGHVLTMDDQLGSITRGELLLEDGKIVAVGTGLDATGAEIWDRPAMLAMPGFVDAHRHTWQSAVRHCAVGWDLNAYQRNVQSVIGESFTPEDAYVANLLGSLTAIDAGITTLRDESHVQNSPEHTDALIRGLQESGIRACFAYGWPSTDAMSWLWDSKRLLPQDILRVRDEVLCDDDALVTLNAHLRGPELSDRAVTLADVHRARDLGLRMSMHMGTGEYGERYHGIAALEEMGLIGSDMTFVHCCTSDDRELDLMAEHNASACVTPAVEANMSGLGAPATGRLLSCGIRPALGVDVEVGTSSDMFNIMRAALLSERLRSTLLGDVAIELTARDLLSFATRDGAAACGLDHHVGSLTPGKQADLILVNGEQLNLLPSLNWEGGLVAAGHPGNVDTVLVAGTILKSGGQLTHPDLDGVMKSARKSGRRLLDLIPGATDPEITARAPAMSADLT